MGTDYDSWMLNIVEGDSEEYCEECECEECECDQGPDEDTLVANHEARMQERWDRFVADL
jgi:hypothetical protein